MLARSQSKQESQSPPGMPLTDRVRFVRLVPLRLLLTLFFLKISVWPDRSFAKQRRAEGNPRPATCFKPLSARPRRTTANTTEIGKLVVTSVVTRPVFEAIFSHFTYEKRRGRESNPRIAVLQTATLPLGYPAELRERTISLYRRLYQAPSVDTKVLPRQRRLLRHRFNASTNPIIVPA